MATQNFGRHEGENYITSTAQRMYKSDPYVSKPGEAREMILPRKYRAGWITAPKQNKHSDNQRLGPKKTSGQKRKREEMPPSKVMVCFAGTGHRVMMTREEFAALDWGWVIE